MATANPKSLKIGLVIDTSLDPTDGVQQYVVTIGEWLSAQGHEVHYLAGETKTRDLPNLHSLARNFTVKFNGNRTTIPLPTNRRRLRAFIQEQQFDVLHVQTPHHPLLAQRLILAADQRTAIIGTFHILPYGGLSRIGNHALGMWLRPSLRRFDRMLAVSPAAAEFCEETFHVKADVLPNVIDYPLFHNAQPLAAYVDAVPTILFLGRLVPRKGSEILVQAAAALRQRTDVPEFRVVICGKGALEAKLRNLITHHKLDDTIELAGFVSEADKPRYYASADIAVFPSSGGESFGIVLLEAMASGKAAVLAGDNPGYRSVMSPQPDLLFAAKDVTQLADKLAQLLTDATRRQQLAVWGEKYTQDFDVDVVGTKLVEIYNEALHKRRAL